MACPSRLRGNSCSIDPVAQPHEIHVALNSVGRVIARWLMVPKELADTEPPPYPPEMKETQDGHQ